MPREHDSAFPIVCEESDTPFETADWSEATAVACFMECDSELTFLRQAAASNTPLSVSVARQHARTLKGRH